MDEIIKIEGKHSINSPSEATMFNQHGGISLKRMENLKLPFMSAELAGLGGQIKLKAEDFVVEEIPLYEASGEGPHVYLHLRRKSLGTREMVDDLSKRYALPTHDIGYAGLKDKDALTSQFFSLPLTISETELRAKSQDAPWEILSISRHANKIKTGHLLGNRFSIFLSGPEKKLSEAQEIAKILKVRGVANFFGSQRFGHDGDNAEKGLNLLLKGRRGKNWKDKFLFSSLQSFIYNHYLALRIKEGFFEKILDGEICKKYATGGLFISQDGELETQRLKSGELSSTGPIWGSKMKTAQNEAEELERRALAEFGLKPEMMNPSGVGDRRINRLLLPELEVIEAEGGLLFTFTLSKGSYATTVMREFMKDAT